MVEVAVARSLGESGDWSEWADDGAGLLELEVVWSCRRARRVERAGRKSNVPGGGRVEGGVDEVVGCWAVGVGGLVGAGIAWDGMVG